METTNLQQKSTHDNSKELQLQEMFLESRQRSGLNNLKRKKYIVSESRLVGKGKKYFVSESRLAGKRKKYIVTENRRASAQLKELELSSAQAHDK